MPKILHLATDEKFIDTANFLYEKAFPNANDFYVILPDVQDYKLKFVSEKPNYFFYKDTVKNIGIIGEKLKYYDIVILHGFDFFKARIVNKHPEVIYNWLLWGIEIYNDYSLKNTILYGEKTKLLVKKESYSKTLIKSFYRLLKYGVFNVDKYKLKALKKTSYLSILHKEDYDLIHNNGIINNTTKYLKFTYAPIEFILDTTKDIWINNHNILLGNSASKTNNHIEALDLLKTLDLSDRKVITPLSYGDNQYRDIILNYGNKELKNNFEGLTTFMPLQDYNNILQTCGIVIMNHYRQQGVGNILPSMWMGAKVFLDKRNVFYHYLKRIGCYVFSMEELSNHNLINLKPEEMQHNRSVLLKEIGTDTIVETLKADIDTIIV